MRSYVTASSCIVLKFARVAAAHTGYAATCLVVVPRFLPNKWER